MVSRYDSNFIEKQTKQINGILDNYQKSMPLGLVDEFKKLRPKILEKLLVHYPMDVFEQSEKLCRDIEILIVVIAYDTAQITRFKKQSEILKQIHKFALEQVQKNLRK